MSPTRREIEAALAARDRRADARRAEQDRKGTRRARLLAVIIKRKAKP